MTPGMMYSMPHREARRNLRHSTQKGSPTKLPSRVILFIMKTWRPWSLSKKPKKTAKKVIRELNINEKSIKIARDRALLAKDILQHDVVPSPCCLMKKGSWRNLWKVNSFVYLKRNWSLGIILIITSMGQPSCYCLHGLLCLPNSQRWLWMLWLHLWYLWWHPISKGQWRVAESKCSSSGTEFSWTDNSTP